MLPPVTRWSLLLSTLDEVGVGTEGVFSLLRLASCELSRGAYDSLSGVARAEVEVGRFESVPGLDLFVLMLIALTLMKNCRVKVGRLWSTVSGLRIRASMVTRARRGEDPRAGGWHMAEKLGCGLVARCPWRRNCWANTLGDVVEWR